MSGILTVTTPAADRSLLTIEELRAACGVRDASKDVALAVIGARVSTIIAAWCGVVGAFPEQPTLRAEIVTEVFRNAAGAPSLILGRRFVSSITSVVEDGATLAATGYELFKSTGLLKRLSSDAPSEWTAAKITVVYTAGFATVPDNLKAAAAKLALDFYAANTRDPNLRSAEVEGAGTLTYWVPPASDPLMSAEIRQLLDPYMDWTI